MIVVWLWQGRGGGRGLLSGAAAPVPGIVGIVIVLKLISKALFVICAMHVQFKRVSRARVVMGGWVCSILVKGYIFVAVLYMGEQIGGFDPL